MGYVFISLKPHKITILWGFLNCTTWIRSSRWALPLSISNRFCDYCSSGLTLTMDFKFWSERHRINEALMLYAISDFRGVKPIRFFRTSRSHPLKLEDIDLYNLYFF